jgi:hypothetical protein
MAKSDAELIDENLCPVCMVPRRTKRCEPRRALMAHILSRRDPAHVLWREAHYKDYFKHGGDRSPVAREITARDLKEAVRAAFGERAASLVITVETPLAHGDSL